MKRFIVVRATASDPFAAEGNDHAAAFRRGGGLLQARETVTTWCGLPWRWRLHRLRLAFLLGNTLLGVDCLQLGDDTGRVAVEVDPVRTRLL